jgi:hypothetical protein
MPEGWRLPLIQGYVSLDLMKDPVKGTSYYAMASSREKSPDYLKHYVSKLLDKHSLDPNEVEQTIRSVIGDDPRSRLDTLLQNGTRWRQP